MGNDTAHGLRAVIVDGGAFKWRSGIDARIIDAGARHERYNELIIAAHHSSIL